MVKRKTFGEGKQTVKFIWYACDGNQHYVEYRANTRKGIARIMHRFLRGLSDINHLIKHHHINKIIASCKQFGYRWLACQCPQCVIKTTSRDGQTEYKKYYQFHYRFISFVTFARIAELKKTCLYP